MNDETGRESTQYQRTTAKAGRMSLSSSSPSQWYNLVSSVSENETKPTGHYGVPGKKSWMKPARNGYGWWNFRRALFVIAKWKQQQICRHFWKFHPYSGCIAFTVHVAITVWRLIAAGLKVFSLHFCSFCSFAISMLQITGSGRQPYCIYCGRFHRILLQFSCK